MLPGRISTSAGHVPEAVYRREADLAGQIDAVVNLGARFDIRVYWLPALAEMPVWELDQPENVEPERVRPRKLFGAVPARVKLVPIDFDREEPGTVLHRTATRRRSGRSSSGRQSLNT